MVFQTNTFAYRMIGQTSGASCPLCGLWTFDLLDCNTKDSLHNVDFVNGQRTIVHNAQVQTQFLSSVYLIKNQIQMNVPCLYDLNGQVVSVENMKDLDDVKPPDMKPVWIRVFQFPTSALKLNGTGNTTPCHRRAV